MRSLWKGAISFGLVSIPIKLFAATEDHTTHFRQLHKECKTPIKYEKVCPVCNRTVSQDEIVRGYEYQPGKFVIVNDEDMERIPEQSVKSIDIIDFTDISRIDPIYYDKTYYMAPEVIGSKAYVLLRDAMKKTNTVAIAKVVIRSKQDLACLRVFNDNYMAMETMFFADEIRKTDELPPIRQVEPRDNEVEMSLKLIDTMKSDFEPEKYDDTYRKALLEVIEAKIQGQETVTPEKAEKQDNTLDLVAALKASIDAADKGGQAKSKGHKRKEA